MTKYRFSVDIDADLHARLIEARAMDGCGLSTRARLLLQLWADDEQLQQRVADRLIAQRRRGMARTVRDRTDPT